jgi:hypothetical protein
VSVASLAVLALCLAGQGFGSAAEPGPAMQTIIPPATAEPLVNPGMGIYLDGTLDSSLMPPDAWFAKVIAIGYFRDDWADLEPDGPNTSHYDEYFGPIFDLWVKQWGKQVSLRFMCSNMHSRRRCVTPEWVFDQGVPFVKHRGLYTEEQLDPVFWDDRYLDIQEDFIARLGRYLDGRPGVEFIDIGSIGEWGEMHLSRWTAEELRATGFTEETYIAAYRRIIDAFAKAFPHTRVFLNVGDYDTINDYAALRHMHFRQDGLTPSGPSADVGNRFYRPYSRRGVICNYEFHSGYEEMLQRGWGVRETFNRGLEDPMSYLHINVTNYWQLADPPAELKEAILDAARRIGFRFALEQLRCNQAIRLDGAHPGRLVLEETWRNQGVAPCYDSYALRWQLVDANGRVVMDELRFPERPTTLWWPGEQVQQRDLVLVPADVPPGTYRLRVAMVKPEAPELRIQLGVAGRQADGSYDLGQVAVERVAAKTEVAYEEGFETGTGGWTAVTGMAMERDADARSGEWSLRLRGTEPGAAWSYAAVPVPVQPYSLYRLSCWMKVAAIEPAEAPPYLKLGVDDAAGKWITNLNTNQYDLTKIGTWQQLVAHCDTPPETASGVIAIEKGVLEMAINVSMLIDDVKLELLESP